MLENIHSSVHSEQMHVQVINQCWEPTCEQKMEYYPNKTALLLGAKGNNSNNFSENCIGPTPVRRNI